MSIGSHIIESLNLDPKPTAGCRTCMSSPIPVGNLTRTEVEIANVAATTFREHQGTGAPTKLPDPDEGLVRIWLKNSEFNPRVLEVYVTDKSFTAVVEWPRDYHDVSEDEILRTGADPSVFEDRQAVIRTIVAQRLVREAPSVHRTFAVEHGAWGQEFEVYEEHDKPKTALERFHGLRGCGDKCGDGNEWIQSLMREHKKALLRVNGVYGLTETYKGHRLLEAIVEAIRLDLFSKPIKYDDYKKAVDNPLDAAEANAFVNMGILCSKCPGMTWGDAGYEIMRGMRGA
jgi:hypothetical protein